MNTVGAAQSQLNTGSVTLDVVNVKTFGAIGDGVANDTAAIQAALYSNYLRIYIPPGTYNITTPLQIPSNKRLTLAPAATLRRMSSAWAMLLNDADGETAGYTATTNVIIEGGAWDANARTFPQACTVIGIGHSSDIVIRDCVIRDVPVWHGIEINGSRRVLVERVEVDGCANEAIQLDTMNASASGVFPWFGPYNNAKCFEVSILHCTFNNVLTAIGSHSAPAAENVTIRGCVINGSTAAAITPNGYVNLTIEGCQFNRCHTAYRGASNGLVFRANEIANSTAADVNVTNSTNVVIADNKFFGTVTGVVGAPTGTVSIGNAFEPSRVLPPRVIGGAFADRIDFSGGLSPTKPVAYVVSNSVAQSTAVSADDDVCMSVTASGTPPLSYQWYKDGLAVSGATARSFMFNNSTGPVGGSYAVRVSNPSDSTISAPILVIATMPGLPLDRAILRNLSVRALLEASDPRLVVGFGVSDGDAKHTLIRGIGPSLRSLGVESAVGEVQLAIYNAGGVKTMEASSWDASLRGVFDAVGAFQLTSGSRDTAVLANLPRGPGSVSVTAANGGVALVEIYDAAPFSGSRFVNLSALAKIGPGDGALIAGFSVSGVGSKRLLIRGVGPSLSIFGVPSPSSAVVLEVFNAAGILVARSEGWGADLVPSFASVGAFELLPGRRDAALVASFRADQTHTAVIRGAGAALVEIYSLP